VAVLIGTSGWHYRHWRGGLYPAPLPTRTWLGHYSNRFATVELNNAFYRLPDTSAFEAWSRTVPDDFVVSVKASRFLTHIRRLHEPEEPVERLMRHARGLGSKLGPVLLQLPPNLQVDLAALRRTLAAFPRDARVAVEARHDSWFVPATQALLEGEGAALCLTDTGGRHGPLLRTTDWAYVRLHCGQSRPTSCYGRSALDTWSRRLAELWPADADAFVYFNNDSHGCAPRDARRFALAARRHGLAPTRVPTSRETRLTPV
jgi:uncharacterized protein YecE (DUF72 family)